MSRTDISRVDLMYLGKICVYERYVCLYRKDMCLRKICV